MGRRAVSSSRTKWATARPVDPRIFAFGPTTCLAAVTLATIGISPTVAATHSHVVVSNYTDPSISGPSGIAAGPDGALWFTNYGNNSIGRITTAGLVTNYTDPSIADPFGITAGPDGALWFTNYGNRLDRADHHRRGGHQLHRPEHQPPARDHGRARRGLWFTNTTATARSGGSPPPGSSPTTPTRASAHPHGIAAGPDGALWFTNYGNNSIGRITTAGVVTNYTDPSISDPHGIAAGPTGPCGSPTTATTRSGGSPPAGWSSNYTAPHHRQPQRITAGPDGALWFTNEGWPSIGRITTAGVVSTTPTPASATRRASRPDPTGRCGSPTAARPMAPSARSAGSQSRSSPALARPVADRNGPARS